MTNWRERANQELEEARAASEARILQKLQEEEAKGIEKVQRDEQYRRAAEGSVREFDQLNLEEELRRINEQVWEGLGEVKLESEIGSYRKVALEATYIKYARQLTERHKRTRFGSYTVGFAKGGGRESGPEYTWEENRFGFYIRHFDKIIGVEPVNETLSLRVSFGPERLAIHFSGCKLKLEEDLVIDAEIGSLPTFPSAEEKDKIYMSEWDKGLVLEFPLDRANRDIFEAFLWPALHQSCVYMLENPLSDKIRKGQEDLASARSRIGTEGYGFNSS